MPPWLEWLLGLRGIRPGSEVEWVWAWLPPAWFIALVLVPGALLLFGLFYRLERAEAGVAPRVFLTFLRVAVFLLILLMLFGPALHVATRKRERQNFILLYDVSLSMRKSDRPADPEKVAALARLLRLPDPQNLTPQQRDRIGHLTRIEIARAILKNEELRFLERLEQEADVHAFAFGGTIRPVEDARALAAQEADAPETAIGDALQQALTRLQGRSVSGIFLISDGRTNTGQDPVQMAEQVGGRIPIYTIAPGYARPPVDIEIRDLQALDAIVIGDRMAVRFRVIGQGLEGAGVPAEVWLVPALEADPLPATPDQIADALRSAGARRLETRTVTLAGLQPAEVTVQITPEEVGLFNLIVRVPPREDEITPENNFRVQRLRVADDHIRVLLVDELPRYEFRFLRNALKRDQKKRMHSLLTGADPMYPQDSSPGLEPLPSFPEDLRRLVEYDVLILGDVPLERLGGDLAARMIHDFVVEHGGGLILQTGRFWNPWAYAQTPLEPLLPFVPRERGPLPAYANPLAYVLEPDGETHPVTQWSTDTAENRRIWGGGGERGPGLPPVRVYYPVERLKPAAIPLVRVRDPSQPGALQPLFAYMLVGRGRVLVSFTDETWVWREYNGDYPYFYSFWDRAIQWARRGKLSGAQRSRIEVDKPEYVLGEEVRIYASAWDSELRPLETPELCIFAEPPAGDRIEIRLPAVRDRRGAFEGRFRPDRPGEYRLWAETDDPDQRRYTRFTVFIPNREDQNPILDELALRNIARASAQSGGCFVAPHELAEFLAGVRSEDRFRIEQTRLEIWSAPVAYLLIALLLTTEWITRKILRML